MPAPDYPDVRIESDGIPWKTKITVDGVMVPCTKITWTADANEDSTRCELEVPHVSMSTQVRDLIARYVDHKVSTPWFWWHCPCGVQMGHPSIEACASGFHHADNHTADCMHVPASPAAVLPVSTED